MRFNSIVFIEFALIFFLGWAILKRKRPAALWYLLIASWVFYAYATWWFVPILVGTATLDWALALGIEKWPLKKKWFVVLSCVSNLGVLALFKYSGFFAQNFNDAFGMGIPIPKLLLPIGISFYTFQSLSYVFDVYRGKTSASKSWLEFLTIVSLFAHLVAGPIVRVSNILPQLRALKKPTPEDVWAGLDLICIGFFKKLVMADRLADYADTVFLEPHPTGATVVLGTVAFAFQIYYDFSGYTDIARGLAKWLGLDFGLNFNHPYGSVGLTEFWTRWHISLTSWVRDYLYIPLGGNRGSSLKTYRNLWICFVLSGLWHGANWTFVVWGGLHAAFISVEKLTNWPVRLGRTAFGKLTGAGITFLLVCFGWVFFRADTLTHAVAMLKALAVKGPPMGLHRPTDFVVLLLLAGGIGYEAKVFLQRHEMVRVRPMSGTMLAIRNGVLLALCIVAPGLPRTFIYFQF